jgi:hypothetical protein
MLLFFAYTGPMGLDVGGYKDHPEWPKMGPSLLIATADILAIRTAKWSPITGVHESDRNLEVQIEYASNLADCVLSALMSRKPEIFPSRKTPWYLANDDDAPK